jgi:hypothetical protein
MKKDKIFKVIDFMKSVDSKQATLDGETTDDAKAKKIVFEKKEKPTEQEKAAKGLREASNKRLKEEKRSGKIKEKKLDTF